MDSGTQTSQLLHGSTHLINSGENHFPRLFELVIVCRPSSWQTVQKPWALSSLPWLQKRNNITGDRLHRSKYYESKAEKASAFCKFAASFRVFLHLPGSNMEPLHLCHSNYIVNGCDAVESTEVLTSVGTLPRSGLYWFAVLLFSSCLALFPIFPLSLCLIEMSFRGTFLLSSLSQAQISLSSFCFLFFCRCKLFPYVLVSLVFFSPYIYAISYLLPHVHNSDFMSLFAF